MKNVLFCTVILTLLFSCNGEPANDTPNKEVTKTKNERPVIAAVNYPLAYFASKLVGDQAEVFFPEIEGDPAFWKPESEDIIRFQNADLILLNGAGYAKWVDNASLPISKTINTTKGIQDQYIVTEVISHSHGAEGEHSHGSRAFTTWLDMKIALYQAEQVKKALEKVLDDKEDLEIRFSELSEMLKAMDQKLEGLFQKLQGRVVFASHPVYQYLARAYNIEMVSMHWEPEIMPNGHDWSHFATDFKKSPSKLMLWEGAPIDEIANNLKNYGMKVVVFDPCGNRPASGDFESVMKENLTRLGAYITSTDI